MINYVYLLQQLFWRPTGASRTPELRLGTTNHPLDAVDTPCVCRAALEKTESQKLISVLRICALYVPSNPAHPYAFWSRTYTRPLELLKDFGHSAHHPEQFWLQEKYRFSYQMPRFRSAALFYIQYPKDMTLCTSTNLSDCVILPKRTMCTVPKWKRYPSQPKSSPTSSTVSNTARKFRTFYSAKHWLHSLLSSTIHVLLSSAVINHACALAG